ncbi:uncharacterized protein SETTUDRAFT_153128 [Exserohilum turcica Et28A]|uniref:Cell division cycle protein 123 n=1 Tax=Exserohilum turcicum (strain 28A) TaxID=671987 RepID=R0KTB7_EXST2|nr:uncharacterized protein SETTUDRAFT_153128 [Exserohilum turcica Et28A]EOA92154.1 hypothetical protein SETTUDRAFT_153128 [Exserohilum turcica Et28A]
MQILKIPYSLVAASSSASTNDLTDSSHPESPSHSFNTVRHTLSEILPVVPENPPSFTHCASPTWKPYNYTFWHALIARSQGLQESQHHIIQLPGLLYQDLTRCYSSWLSSSRIRETSMREALETLASTRAGKDLAVLLDGRRKWFIRLDQMSPKDSAMRGALPASTPHQMLQMLCSSNRAYTCLLHEKEDAEAEGRDMSFKLVLNVWRDDMNTSREFRVFVPPPGATSTTSDATMDVAGVAQRLQDFKISFTFDVALQQDGSVQLVELNPFGATSGCGPCLFNWVRDGKMLYGLDEAKFAVTVA